MVDLSAALNIGTADSEGQAQGRVIDEGRIGGETLVDFHQQPQARRARLHIAHVLVCRLYTCPVDATIQRWLRNVGQERSSFSGLHRMKTKHPMTMLVETLSEAFRRLRIVSMDGANKPAQGPTDIYATWRVRQRLQAEFRSRSAVEQLYADGLRRLREQWRRAVKAVVTWIGTESWSGPSSPPASPDQPARRASEELEAPPHPWAAGDAGAGASTHNSRRLWRGISGVQIPSGFREQGGTEPGFMSCSVDVKTALSYALKGMLRRQDTRGLILMFDIRDMSNPLLCGAPLKWISCFPDEEEEAFPPLTLIKPLPTEPGATAVEEVVIGDMTFEVLKMYLTASES